MSNILSNFTDEQLIEEVRSRGYKVAGVTLKTISENNKRMAESKKEELIKKFKEQKINENSEFKSINDLDISISEETVKWAIETGICSPED